MTTTMSRENENLHSPDKVHPVANDENKNNIKLTDLTKMLMKNIEN